MQTRRTQGRPGGSPLTRTMSHDREARAAGLGVAAALRLFTRIAIVLAVLAAAQGATRLAEAEPTTVRLIVGLAPEAGAGALTLQHASLGADQVRALDGSRLVIIDAPKVASPAATYRAHPNVAFVELDRPVYLIGDARLAPRAASSSWAGWPAASTLGLSLSRAENAVLQVPFPNDPFFDRQWHHQVIGSVEAWSYGRADGVVVAIIDTGVECDHPDLKGICRDGYDYYNDDPDPADGHGHGTFAAGLVGAIPDNGIGVAGLGWGAWLMPLKAIGDGGQGRLSGVVSAIEHAADNGADIINMSFGTGEHSPALQSALRYAASRGVLLAAPGGNGGDGPVYPAAYSEVVGVAGTYPDDGHPPFTTGDHLEVAAPAWDIVSTAPTSAGSYARSSGTSQAVPLVSGLAALLVGKHPEWTVEEVRLWMSFTAIDLGEPGWDEEYGWGRIDAGRAMDPTQLPTPHSPTPTPVVRPEGHLLYIPRLAQNH